MVILAPGEYGVYDPAASAGCLRLPAPAAGETEYLVALVSGAGDVTETGVSGPFNLRTAVPASPGPSLVPESQSVPRRNPTTPEVFHHSLRMMEQNFPVGASQRFLAPPAPTLAPPPIVGSERVFSICKVLACTSFDTLTAVARYVDAHVAVYLDKIVPTADPFTQEDLGELGRTFELYHYPIDRNAFGNESDLDGNGVVAILLTDAVNALTPDCSNGRILGFFWPGDLLNITGSNGGEVFYGMVPSPPTTGCTAATREKTVDRLKPTMIHELQHMISYNQHVLIRNAPNGELAWLNEALSHYAEELGGRLIPNAECVGFTSCRSQYISGNLLDAYDFLENTEGTFLVVPSSKSPSLEERGAGWMFLRWLTDHYGSDSLGTNLTRALVQTTLRGDANVVAATGGNFPSLVAEWMLASYVDDLDNFTPLSDRITYKSWGFRATFLANCCEQNSTFPKAFPTDAPVIVGPFSRSGTLRGGSGKHFRIVRMTGSLNQDLILGSNTSGDGIDQALKARIAIARIQ